MVLNLSFYNSSNITDVFRMYDMACEIARLKHKLRQLGEIA